MFITEEWTTVHHGIGYLINYSVAIEGAKVDYGHVNSWKSRKVM